MITRRVRHVP